jgi:hypothetical protein
LVELNENPATVRASRSVAYRYVSLPMNIVTPPAPGGVPPNENGELAIAVSAPELALIENPSTASFKKSETYNWPVVDATIPVLWFGPGATSGVLKAPEDWLMVKAKIWLVLVAKRNCGVGGGAWQPVRQLPKLSPFRGLHPASPNTDGSVSRMINSFP